MCCTENIQHVSTGAFEYFVFDSIEEAIRLLSSCGKEAKFFAGARA
jgi:CO/xanthine dehydrogenase FAD-binding subunit